MTAGHEVIGETAVVAGGGHSIGEATAHELARNGLDVAVFDVDGAAAADAAAAVRERGPAASVHEVDVADGTAVDRHGGIECS